MTSAIVIKNLILFILIILIGHFLVKNFLFDKVPSSSKLDNNTPNSTTAIATLQVQPQQAKQVVVKDDIEPTISKQEKEPEGLDKAKAELLKFVDEGDEGDLIYVNFGKDMNKYFNTNTALPPVSTDDCKSVVQTSQFPLSTTCDPNIQSLKTSMKKETPRKPRACINLTKNVLVLNEYDNESSMNGGELFNGLNAFDNFDNHFQLLN